MNIQFLIILCLKLGIDAFGKRDRIIGGESVEINEFPYMASLRNIIPNYHFCSGTIITNKHVLSTGYCLFYKQDALTRIRVYTGSSNPSSASGQSHKILKVDIHPAFEPTSIESHDLAVITLVENILFSNVQKSINLPVGNIREGNFGVVLGWGTTNYPSTNIVASLNKLHVKILTTSKCNKFYEKPIQKHQFCGFASHGVGVCYGDSGGPLVFGGKVIGIVSSNIPCAQGYPDIFINVFDYLGFIKHIIEQ